MAEPEGHSHRWGVVLNEFESLPFGRAKYTVYCPGCGEWAVMTEGEWEEHRATLGPVDEARRRAGRVGRRNRP